MLNKSQAEVVKKSSYKELVTNHPEIFYLLKKHILLKNYGFINPPRIHPKVWTPELISRYFNLCKNVNQFKTLFFDAYIIAQRSKLLKKLTTKHQAISLTKKVKSTIPKKVILKVYPEVIPPKDSLGEQLVRKAFFYHFKVDFHKTKPKWLLNPKTESTMELDGFNRKLKVAFEVNGVHHYQKKFTKNSDVKFKDQLKMKLCKERKIKLYVIKFIALPQLIKNLHKEFNIPIKWLTETLLKLNSNEKNINHKIKKPNYLLG